MKSSNQPVAGGQEIPLSKRFNMPKINAMMVSMFGGQEKADRVKSSIITLSARTPGLKECTWESLLQAASIGEDLNLPMSATLGYYYMIPYKEKVRDANGRIVYLTNEDGTVLQDKRGYSVVKTEMHATFVIGYKGLWQLAMRSGLYRRITVLPIKQGEFSGYNALTEELHVQIEPDATKRQSLETVGYYAAFELTNGFFKSIYWTKDKMMFHADEFSPAFSASAYQKIQNGQISDKDMWKYSSFWYKDFDGMAEKTMIRQLLSKYGALSPELQKAFVQDTIVAEYAEPDIIPDALPEEKTHSEPPAQIPEQSESAQMEEMPFDFDSIPSVSAAEL